MSRLLRGPHLSRWFEMPQSRIDAFADATDDHQAIHLDPAAAPGGETMAHGFLTLSMLSAMAYDAVPETAARMGINYGFDRIRFVAPVRAGRRVRGRLELTAADPAGAFTALSWDVTVEIENEAKPAVAARWLTRLEGSWTLD